MGQLRITLLGTFEVRRPRGPALVLPKKTRALLAYLALTPGYACSREELATLLWGDTGEAQARQSLRQALRRLRTALGPGGEAVRIDGEMVALDPTAVEVDTLAFERLITEDGPEALARAVALYRGELLAGLDLDEKPFEEWLIGQRERLRESALVAAGQLVAHHTHAGVLDDAVRAASRVLTIDPLHEAAHRALMRIHAAQGRRSAALRQYQACVEVLQRELGVEPEAETRQLYQEIVRERVAAPHAHPASAPAPQHGAPATARITAEPILFVGRDAERTRLRDVLHEAGRGESRLVAILGEAGIGKTSLVRWMAETAAAAGARVLLGRCHASEQILPFGPWSDALRSGLLDAPHLFERVGERWKGELAHLVPELLAPGVTPPPIGDDPTRLFESVVQAITHLADAAPLVVVLEDLHWADEISLRLLAVVSRRLRARRLLVVVTARDDELDDNAALRGCVRELGRAGALLTLALKPLGKDEVAALVRAVAHLGDGSALDHLITQIWATSEGHPFMAVETVRALEQGTVTGTSSSRLPLPQRVQEVIAARLERVGERGRAILAVAAVIGHDVDFPLLDRAAGLGQMETAAAVEELVRRRLLRVVSERFEFTHDRIREVIDSQLVPPRRRLLHRQVADAIETLYADRLEPEFAALGRHWYEASDWQKAARYLRRAGQSAMEQSASHEAAASFRQALDALGRIPETAETLAAGIDLRLELHSALLLIEHVDRVGYLLDEAQGMAERLGDPLKLGRVTVARGRFLWWSGHGPAAEALRLASEAQAIGERVGSRSLVASGMSLLFQARLASGDYPGVDVAVEAFKRRHGPGAVGSRRWVHEFPYVACFCYRGVALAERGDFDGALGHLHEARTLAEQTDHRPSLIATFWALGEVHLIRGAARDAVDALERVLGFFRDYEVAIGGPVSVAALGYAYVLDGRIQEGIQRLREGLASMATMGWSFSESLALVRLGEACLLDGRVAEARELAQRALAFTREREERGFEARALCLLAEIATRCEPPDVGAADGLFAQALARATELGMQPLIGRVRRGLGAMRALASRPRSRRAARS